jgi:hypothetical protein
MATLRDRRDEIVVVSLNISPSEDASAVEQHAESGGFDWRYAVSPTEVTTSLTDAFGATITSPPSAPVVRVCPSGSAKLIESGGAKPPDALESAINRVTGAAMLAVAVYYLVVAFEVVPVPGA